MANALTIFRIVCGLLIFICPPFTGWYYAFFLLGGFTDAIDGTIARKQGKETALGAKLDTIADIVFVATVTLKLAANLYVPVWLMVWGGIIVIIKIVSITIGFVKYHKFAAVHSILNKVCGIVLFIVFFFIGWDFSWQAKAVGVIVVCILATIAAVQECYLVCTGKVL